MKPEDAKSFLRNHATEIACLITIFAIVCIYRFFTRSITDDAMITYRYARNLAEGHGLVYNVGEYVLGTTTPLYALIIAGGMFAGLQPWTVSLFLDCFLVTGLIALLFYWICEGGDRLFAWIGVAGLLHYPLGIVPNAGMETGQFLLLTYVSLYLVLRGQFTWAAVLAVLSVYTRPEGVLACLLVCIMGAFDFAEKRPRKEWWRASAICAVGAAVYLGFVYSYYGNPLPQSVVAKRVQVEVSSTWNPFIEQFFREQFYAFGKFTLLGDLEWLGLALIAWRLPRLRILVVWFLAYLAFMWIGKAPYYPWYLNPLYPIRTLAVVYAGLMIGRGTMGLFRKHRVKLEEMPWGSQGMAVLIALVMIGSAGWYYFFGVYNTFRWILGSHPILYCKKYEEAAALISSRALPGDETVSPEIGYIGYLGETKVFDPVGLVSPEALEHLGKRSSFEWTVIRESRFSVMSWFQDSGFQRLPDDFLAEYVPAGSWQDTVFQTMVFERGQSLSGELAASSTAPAGIDAKGNRAAYVVQPASREEGRAFWHFDGDIKISKLEFYFNTQQPEPRIVSMILDGEPVAIALGQDGHFRFASPEVRTGKQLIIALETTESTPLLILDPALNP